MYVGRDECLVNKKDDAWRKAGHALRGRKITFQPITIHINVTAF
jgi:hypothetical protein